MGIKVKGPTLEAIEAVGLELERLLKEVPAVEPAAVFADRVIFLSDGAIVRELPLEGDGNVEAIIASLAELGD